MSQALKRYIVVCGITVAVFLILAALFASAMRDDDDATSVEGVQVSSDASAVLSGGVDFGFDSFSRANRGTAKLYSGDYYGYRYPLVSRDAVSVVVTNSTAIVFIPESVSSALGVDIQDKAFQSAFGEMLVAIDSASANGGQVLNKIEPAYLFTGESEVTLDGFTFRYGQEVEELYAESFKMLPLDQISLAGKATGLDAVAEFFSTLDWRPLWVSIKATAIAMVFIFILGLLAAWATIRMSNRWKGIVDTILTIPMVLPPTVCGFLLMLLFGPSTGFGRWLIAHGVDLVFTFPAVVISCFVVAFPLMYRTARGAFESIDTNMLDAARTLGWKESRIFRTLMMPLTWPSIAAGTVLAFARSMGEFGATLFFAGNYAGVTQTIPIAIYFDWMAGDKDAAIFWVGVVILISFLVILFVNTYSVRTQKWKKPAAGHASRADKSYGSESR